MIARERHIAEKREAGGYARNYLLPRKLALTVTEGNRKQIARERHIAEKREADERVAAEAMAFLASWLYGLTSPVLNRPTPVCLMGPNWRQEQWVHAAAQIGIPIHPIYRRSGLNTALSAEVAEVTP